MKTNRSKKGFTLLETLVAVLILAVALVGPMTLAAKGLASAFDSRDQITSAYLAEEGIEFVRAILAGNRLNLNAVNDGGSGTGWLTGLLGCVLPLANETPVCTVDAYGVTDPADAIVAYSSQGSVPMLGIDPVTGRYGYAPSGETWPSSHFKRTIQIVKRNNFEYTVHSVVTWGAGSIDLKEDILKLN